MKLLYSAMEPAEVKADLLVCFLSEFDKLSDKFLKKLDDSTSGAVTNLFESEEFCGKYGEISVLHNPSSFNVKSILLVGLGDKKKIDPDSYRKAAGILSKNKTLNKASKVVFYFGATEEQAYYQAALEGLLLGSFKLVDYKSEDDAKKVLDFESLEFVCDNKRFVNKMEKAVANGQIIAEGQNLVRRLGLTPSNYLTPKMFANEAVKLGKKYGFKTKILDEPTIKKEKMGALLAVSKGSDEPPRFIIMEYNGGAKGRAPIVLVGKGVTFDSGGISLKPGLNMHEMKGDMCGGGVVLSTMVTAARLGIKQNIVGLIPAVENMPSGKATKPGDVHISRKGVTIENINTDAEGRLILADALDYANEFKPQAVIDIATLTGATLFILGYAGAPIMGNNEKLLDRIEDASANTAEKVWPLPIWEEHRDQMKSSVADVVNSGGRPAGTITAAAFLENFIGDYPWAHIDIAYVDVEPSGKHYIPKGVTGIGMRLLTDVLMNWKKL